MTSMGKLKSPQLLLVVTLAIAAEAYALPSAELGQSGCISDPSTRTCNDGTRLNRPVSVALSPDGLNAYAAAVESNSLGVFDRNPVGGTLTQKSGTAGCFTRDGSNGACTATRGIAAAVSSVAVSPDGKNVYVTSDEGVAVFDRDATGALTQKPGAAGCITESGNGGTCAVGREIVSALGVAFTHDGESVYVGIGYSGNSGGLAIFDRNTTTGVLTQKPGTAGCITRLGSNGMCMVGGALGSIGSIAVSPDARNVYVTSVVPFIGLVAVLDRDPATGILTQRSGAAGCLATFGGECTLFTQVGAPLALRVSPDGKHVYVAGFADGIATLDRDQATGVLTPRSGSTACIIEGGNANCSAGVGLDGSNDVAVSADGMNVYVGSSVSDAVAAFDRDPSTGTIVQKNGTAACLSDNGSSAACGDARGLGGATSIAVAADGLNVYVAATEPAGIPQGSITTINRNATTGELSQPDSADVCVSDVGTGTCNAGRGLSNVASVITSPDGRSVYSTSMGVFGIFGTNTIGIFDRDVTSGTLVQATGFNGCFSEGTVADPTCTAGRALAGVNSGVISPDGRSLYTTASFANAIALFDRDPGTGVVFQKTGTAGCISAPGDGGCAGGRGLDMASAVTISPDGRNVYAAAEGSNSVAVFDREPTTGTLTQKPGTGGCIDDAGASGCLNGNGLIGPSAIAMSPDGRNVYAATGTGDDGGVAALDRDSTGALTQKNGAAGCISDSGASGCANGTGLANAKSVAVSPDGKNVYVVAETAQGAPTVAVLDRNVATGALTQKTGSAGCVSTDDNEGCTAAIGLAQARAVAASADGKLVYVASSASNAIAVFDRNRINGALTQRSALEACLSEDGSGPCTKASALQGATGVAVSPDSQSVYVASRLSAAVASFQLEGPACEFTQVAGQSGCASETGSGGSCINANALDGAADVSVSGDQRFLYAVSAESDAVAVFSRDSASGQITQLPGSQGCFSDTGSSGSCGDGKALDGARSLAASGDGKQIYVAAHDNNAVAVLDRDANTGTLTQKTQMTSCVSEDGSSSTCVDAKGLIGPVQVRLSRDNRNLYVVSDSGIVATFGRDPGSGVLTQLLGAAGCSSTDGSSGACSVGRALDGSRSLAVSPDDRQAYVAAPGSNAIAVFDRNINNGALTQRSGTAACISDNGSANCSPANALAGAADIKVSDDGRNAYVAARTSNAIAVFDRDPQSGTLSQKGGGDGCISQDGAAGCSSGVGLTGVDSIHLSANGRYLFALSTSGNTLAIFDRDLATGVIHQRQGQRGCISENGSDGACVDGTGFAGAAAFGRSMDGDFFYIASSDSDAIASLQCGLCGDGNMDAGEQCDDGNLMAGDGCTASCTFDPTPALTRTPTFSRTPTRTPTDAPITPMPTTPVPTSTPMPTNSAVPTLATATPEPTDSAVPTLATATPEPTGSGTMTASPVTQTATASPTGTRSPAACVGDCGGDLLATVDELLVMINIGLGQRQVDECLAGDSNGDGFVTVDEIVRAVNNALNGC